MCSKSERMIRAVAIHNPRLREQELNKRRKQQRIAKIKKIIGYILVLTALTGCIYIILVVAANLETEDTEKWSKSFLISLAQDLGVSQIFKVLLTVVVIRIMAKTRSQRVKKYLAILVDPITVRAIAIHAIK